MDDSAPHPRSEPLQGCRNEFRATGVEAEALAAGLTPAQLWWRPEPDRWSVGECLDHLVRTGEAYLEVLDDAIGEGRRRELFAEPPYRRSLMGRFLIWTLEPPPRLKVPSPEIIRPRLPGGGEALSDPLPRFLALRARLGERLEAAEGLDLGRIGMPSPFFSWMRFDLGSAFRIVAAHERRHLWQATKIVDERGFPAG